MIEKLKSVIYKIVFMVLFFVLAKSCVSDYVTGRDEDKISEWTKMIDDNTFVNANLSNDYTETTIAKVIKLYKFDYYFNLNKQTYSGEITLNEIPNTNKIKLYYLADNPEIVSVDPHSDLKSEKEEGKSISDLLIGIVWGILSLFLLISLVSNFKKKDKIKINTQRDKKTKKSVKKPKTESKEEISEEEKLKLELEKERIRKEKEDPTRFMPK